MKTCSDCMDLTCPDMGHDSPSCENFTSEAIEEEPAVWQPTRGDYLKLEGICYEQRTQVTRLEARVRGFESAVAELVRWAQGEDNPT